MAELKAGGKMTASLPEDDFTVSTLEEQEMLERESFWYRARRDLILWAFGRYCGASKNFMEIGAGTGYVLAAVKEAHPGLYAVGTDIFSEGLMYVRNRLPSCGLVAMDIRSIPAAGTLDAIGIFDVLEHIEDDRQPLDEIFGALGKGGVLIITVPHHQFLWSSLDEYVRHKRRYSRRALVRALSDAGFSVCAAAPFGSLVLPLKICEVLARRIEARSGKKTERIHLVHLPRWVNDILYLVMRCEYFLITHGVRLPFGASLLIVARKG